MPGRRDIAYAFGVIFGLAAVLIAGAEVPDVDCQDLYFGFGGQRDFAAAYACYEAARPSDGRTTVVLDDALGHYGPMVLMRLNGDGVTRDLDEAARLLSEWQKVDHAGAEQRMYLNRVVLERRAGLNPNTKTRLEFCELPGDASFRSRCAEIRRRREDGVRERRVQAVRDQAPEAAQAHLGALVFAFGGYAEREVVRIERARVLDDDAAVAAQDQRERVQAHFDAVLREALVDRTLSPASATTASRAELELEHAFQADRRQQTEMFAAYERSLPDSADRYERYRRTYDDTAEQAHSAWKRYRDAWIEVVRAGADSDRAASAGEAAIRLRLAKQRMSELRPD